MSLKYGTIVGAFSGPHDLLAHPPKTQSSYMAHGWSEWNILLNSDGETYSLKRVDEYWKANADNGRIELTTTANDPDTKFSFFRDTTTDSFYMQTAHGTMVSLETMSAQPTWQKLTHTNGPLGEEMMFYFLQKNIPSAAQNVQNLFHDGSLEEGECSF